MGSYQLRLGLLEISEIDISRIAQTQGYHLKGMYTVLE